MALDISRGIPSTLPVTYFVLPLLIALYACVYSLVAYDENAQMKTLETFDWTQVEPTAYRPFKTKQHVAMGISKMDKSEWIRIDRGYLRRLQERDRIMEGSRPEVIGSGPTVNLAIEELYEEIMIQFLPKRFPTMFSCIEKTFLNKVTGRTYSVDLAAIDHDTMLRNLGENVEEDFYFMCPDDQDELRLQGWIACFPGGFSTTARKGMSMREIHQPVPGFQQRIAKGSDLTMARLQPGDFIERFNVSPSLGTVPPLRELTLLQWSLQSDGGDLFRLDGNNFYPELGQEIPERKKDVDIDQCFLRVEHQTLVRLSKSRAVIFCVRSYMTSLRDIKKEGNGPLLAEAFESMPHKLGDYKMRPFWDTPVYKFLRS
ncbi:hypothetical protein SUNI508_13229 [Seiridium unicorne]|uniref:Uncharacterized protein n=1 Tax=Seiridium unicorne TaxID=138068 RepID=A0ABR2VFC2_9PEZI